MGGNGGRILGWTAIGEGRTKFLLAGIPSGAHVPQEILRRADLFLRRSYEELLSRVELQMAGGGRQGRRRKQTTSHRQEQARRQTAEGADRKAVQTLTTSVAQLTYPRAEHGMGGAASSTRGRTSAPRPMRTRCVGSASGPSRPQAHRVCIPSM